MGQRTAKIVNKYNNKKQVVDDIKFDSSMEVKFYKALKKDNIEFTMRDIFELQPKFPYKGKTLRAINYVSDFKVLHYVIDIKGMKTSDFKLKEKMFKYRYGKELELVCLLPCPKKYLNKLSYENFWEHLGFVDYDLIQKLRKESRKGE